VPDHRDTADRKITRDDLEAKFREIKGDVDQRTKAAKDTLMPLAIFGGLLVLVLVYIVGKRVGKTKSTVVEIRRI
jgi:hypothetical protein